MNETTLRLDCGCEASAPSKVYDEIDLYHRDKSTWVCTSHGLVKILRVSRHRSV